MYFAGGYFFTLKGGENYVKVKFFAVLAILGLLVFSGAAYSAQTEDALSSRPDDAVYIVLRLEDTARFLQWLFSKDNLNLFMPLIMKGQSQADVMVIAETINAFVSVSPLRSAAVVVGVTRKDVKSPFLQAAFKVSPELSDTVKKVADGTANASDIARLLIGDKMAAAFAETMIKVSADKGNILRVNNEVFMTARDDVVLVGASINDVRLALRALNEEDSRLFTKITRKFTDEDFALLHVDYETAADLDDKGEIDDLDARKYFAKPLNVEFAFKRFTDKFRISTNLNLREALAKKYADKLQKQAETWKAVKGGNIDLANVGGSASPIAAMGTYINFESIKDDELWKPAIKSLLRNMRVRFKVSEEETAALLTGPFSAVVNDTVTYEGFKIPALYVSQTGKKGAAAKVFERFTNSQHFAKVQEGVLQLDSSISPISCLAANKGEVLCVDFAELDSLAAKPELKPALSELLEHESIASMWFDFAGVQAWINDEENGVFATVAPFATFMGYGKYVQAARDILGAELSVPSVSIWGPEPETIYTEFALKDIDVNNGLFARIIKVYNDFTAKPAAKSAPKSEDTKPAE